MKTLVAFSTLIGAATNRDVDDMKVLFTGEFKRLSGK